MKIFDNLLLIAAGFSLYTLTAVFSNHYFAGINQYIPDLFSGRASVTLSSTFHLVIASIITGFLFTRFASRPLLIALLVAIAINFESYLVVLKNHTMGQAFDYYLANPSEILNLFKPLVILPLMTYFIGFLPRAEATDNQSDD
ncbi:MAG: hypothetical protein ACI9N9_001665 [Enterobacterales bacterium]|jgi:hypothetical protein